MYQYFLLRTWIKIKLWSSRVCGFSDMLFFTPFMFSQYRPPTSPLPPSPPPTSPIPAPSSPHSSYTHLLPLLTIIHSPHFSFHPFFLFNLSSPAHPDICQTPSPPPRYTPTPSPLHPLPPHYIFPIRIIFYEYYPYHVSKYFFHDTISLSECRRVGGESEIK